jgi:hypothetical protein
MRATQGRDDSHGHRLTNPERIADGQRDVTHHDILHFPERDCRQDQFLAVLLGDLEYGKVGLRVTPDEAGIEVAAVAEGYLDLVGSLDNMKVRENIAVLADNDSRTEPGGPWTRPLRRCHRRSDGIPDRQIADYDAP